MAQAKNCPWSKRQPKGDGQETGLAGKTRAPPGASLWPNHLACQETSSCAWRLMARVRNLISQGNNGGGREERDSGRRRPGRARPLQLRCRVQISAICEDVLCSLPYSRQRRALPAILIGEASHLHHSDPTSLVEAILSESTPVQSTYTTSVDRCQPLITAINDLCMK